MLSLQQWECKPCGIGPIGAMDYAICPKCRCYMSEVKFVVTGTVTGRYVAGEKEVES